MKKTGYLILTLIIGFVLGGLVFFPRGNIIRIPTPPNAPDFGQNGMPPSAAGQNGFSVLPNQPTRDEGLYHTLAIPNTGISVSVPKKYSLGKEESWGDGGINFTRYDFLSTEKAGDVLLKNISIWTGESDNLYFEICTDQSWCKNKGEQISVLNNYYFEKRALEGRQDYQDFKYQPVGNWAWFVRDTRCENKDCVEREYSIFIANKRIATVVVVKNQEQLILADKIFSELEISAQN